MSGHSRPQSNEPRSSDSRGADSKSVKSKRAAPGPVPEKRQLPTWVVVTAIVATVLGVGFTVLALNPTPELPEEIPSWMETQPTVTPTATVGVPRQYQFGEGRLNIWWDGLPQEVISARVPTDLPSNAAPADYAGPESCRKCHRDKYEAWSTHPHRWMNALADTATVLGDFSGQSEMRYRGGLGKFYQRDGQYLMDLRRGGVRRVYRVTQTLGSRFFQYYIGTLIEGPEHPEHPFRLQEHVLPLGYWIDEKQWVPTVHVGPELPDAERPDPFDPPTEFPFFSVYATNCSQCHSTYAVGDWMIRKPELASRHTPHNVHIDVSQYLAKAHPEVWDGSIASSQVTNEQFLNLLSNFGELSNVRTAAVCFGITCEACHYGARAHAEGELKKPLFFPNHPDIHTLVKSNPEQAFARTDVNVSWACGKCHTGERPRYANGISTWNSTEYADALRGSCYSRLMCVDCHDPHQATGKKWTHSADSDDAKCLKCHQAFQPDEARVAHTHHPLGSPGSRCMNCHMPRINEGMQDMVRTHTITSPTQKEMIESNHPNACNMCHTEEPIDFTLKHLAQWYGATYDDQAIAANYPERTESVVLNWLKGENEAVRLVAADSLFRQKVQSAIPELLKALDDPFLINRQFAQRRFREQFDFDVQSLGYRFYMMPDERREILKVVRQAAEQRFSAAP